MRATSFKVLGTIWLVGALLRGRFDHHFHLDLHASLVRSLGMLGVTNVRLVPTAEGADRYRWMPNSESYVSPDGRLKVVLGKPGEVRMGLGVWTEARLFEEGAERTRRHGALLEVVGNRLLPRSCYVPWDSSSQHLMLAHLINDAGQLAVGVVAYDVSQRAVVHQNYRSGQRRRGRSAMISSNLSEFECGIRRAP